MKKKRFNLFLNIAVLCMCVAAIAIGVYSAKNASLAVSGTVGFNAHDCDVDIDAILYGDSVNANQSNAQETDYGVVRSKEFAKTFSQIKIRKNDAGVSSGALNLDKFYFCDMTDDDSINPITIELKFTNRSKFRIRAKLAEKISTGNENIIATPDVGDLGSAILLEPEESENIKITLYMISSQNLENIGLEAKFSIYKEKGELEYGYIDQNTGDLATSDTLAENKIPAVIGIGSYDKTEEVLIVPSKGHITNADGTQEEVEAKAIGGRTLTFPLFDENGRLIIDETTQLPKTDERNGLKSKSVLIKEGFKTMFGDSISFNSTIEHIQLPNSLIKILENSFELCTKLKEIVINDNLEYLGANAFAGCISLETVVLPAINTIYDGAFDMCNKVEIYVKATEIPSWNDTTGTGWSNYWNLIARGATPDDSTYAPTYLYSENSPATEGNFWHYVDEKITIWPRTKSITYELDGGVNNENNVSRYKEGTIVKLYNPTKEGAIFNGWMLDGEIVTEIPATATGNITLVATWKEIYTITYELNGGVNDPRNKTTLAKGESMTLYAPTKAGTTFGGWMLNGNIVTSIDSISEDIYLVAKWNEDILTFTVNEAGTGAVLVDVENKSNVLIIPETAKVLVGGEYKTLPVTEIKSISEDKEIFLEKVYMPDTVTTIYCSSFINRPMLEYVKLSNNLIKIEGGAFYYSVFNSGSKLLNIIIPKSVVNLGSRNSGLEIFAPGSKIFFERTSEEMSGVTIEDHWALDNGYKVYYSNDEKTEGWYYDEQGNVQIRNGSYGIYPEQIVNIDGLVLKTMPNGNYTLIDVQDHSITELTIPTDLAIEKIRLANSSFAEKITNVNVDDLTNLRADSFAYLPNLKTVTITNKATTYKSYNGGSIILDANNNVVFGGAEAVIPEEATAIAAYAFAGRKGLKTISITKNITKIESKAFMNCSGLTNIELEEGIEDMSSYYFSNLKGLTEIIIPSTVSCINPESFSYCSGLTKISVASGNTNYDSRDNCNAIIETGSNTLILGCKNTIIPNTIGMLGGFAFRGCTNLTNITIPTSVTTIFDSVFDGCTGLSSIIIPDNVTSISGGVFSNCTALKTVKLGNGITQIYSNLFYNCVSLTSVSMSENVTSFDYDVFTGCSGLQTYDGNLIYININSNPNYYLYGVTDKSLTSAIINDNCKYVGLRVFMNCVNLESVTIGANVVDIGQQAFYNCISLTSVTIPNKVKKIGDNSFSGCTSLKTAIIPDSVTYIDSCAFYGCSVLESVNISDNLTYIKSLAFYKCDKLVTMLGSGWVKVSNGVDVSGTLLKKIDYDVKRSTNA